MLKDQQWSFFYIKWKFSEFSKSRKSDKLLNHELCSFILHKNLQIWKIFLQSKVFVIEFNENVKENSNMISIRMLTDFFYFHFFIKWIRKLFSF